MVAEQKAALLAEVLVSEFIPKAGGGEVGDRP